MLRCLGAAVVIVVERVTAHSGGARTDQLASVRFGEYLLAELLTTNALLSRVAVAFGEMENFVERSWQLAVRFQCLSLGSIFDEPLLELVDDLVDET